MRRHRRVRAKIAGTAERPRLSVFRSGAHVYAQLIDDQSKRTLAAVHSRDIKAAGGEETKAMSRLLAQAYLVGKAIAAKAATLDIKAVVFDRGGYIYHGRVASLAEGARQGGLEF